MHKDKDMLLTHRPVTPKDIPCICGFAQMQDELFFLFPKAAFPLTPSQLQEAIAQRSDSTVVELDGQVVAFANFYRWETGSSSRHAAKSLKRLFSCKNGASAHASGKYFLCHTS